MAAYAVASDAGDASAVGLFAAVETVSVVRDGLHEHAATLATVAACTSAPAL